MQRNCKVLEMNKIDTSNKTKVNKFGMNITTTPQLWKDLSKKYGVDPFEIAQIDLNWSGVSLPNKEVKEDYRVRFNATICDNHDSWFALPVRNEEDTLFNAANNKLYFGKTEIGKTEGLVEDNFVLVGKTGELVLDTCESSYQRGPSLLNLNSRSRSDCAGCNACVHNHKDLYDETVIKDNIPLKSKEDIEKFLDDMV